MSTSYEPSLQCEHINKCRIFLYSNDLFYGALSANANIFNIWGYQLIVITE